MTSRASSPHPRKSRGIVVAWKATVAAGVALILSWVYSPVALAALAKAAGKPKDKNSDTFKSLIDYINHITNDGYWLAAAIGALGFLICGVLMATGDSRAISLLRLTAFGIFICVAAPVIAA
jgi:multisubunit Na+/H+ antiporter MnhG subunit